MFRIQGFGFSGCLCSFHCKDFCASLRKAVYRIWVLARGFRVRADGGLGGFWVIATVKGFHGIFEL